MKIFGRYPDGGRGQVNHAVLNGGRRAGLK